MHLIKFRLFQRSNKVQQATFCVKILKGNDKYRQIHFASSLCELMAADLHG